MKTTMESTKKYNEKILLKKGFVHCTRCKKLICETDKFCQYCGESMEIISS